MNSFSHQYCLHSAMLEAGDKMERSGILGMGGCKQSNIIERFFSTHTSDWHRAYTSQSEVVKTVDGQTDEDHLLQTPILKSRKGAKTGHMSKDHSRLKICWLVLNALSPYV